MDHMSEVMDFFSGHGLQACVPVQPSAPAMYTSCTRSGFADRSAHCMLTSVERLHEWLPTALMGLQPKPPLMPIWTQTPTQTPKLSLSLL